jgi:hypothetical protein
MNAENIGRCTFSDQLLPYTYKLLTISTGSKFCAFESKRKQAFPGRNQSVINNYTGGISLSVGASIVLK